MLVWKILRRSVKEPLLFPKLNRKFVFAVYALMVYVSVEICNFATCQFCCFCCMFLLKLAFSRQANFTLSAVSVETCNFATCQFRSFCCMFLLKHSILRHADFAVSVISFACFCWNMLLHDMPISLFLLHVSVETCNFATCRFHSFCCFFCMFLLKHVISPHANFSVSVACFYWNMQFCDMPISLLLLFLLHFSVETCNFATCSQL